MLLPLRPGGRALRRLPAAPSRLALLRRPVCPPGPMRHRKPVRPRRQALSRRPMCRPSQGLHRGMLLRRHLLPAIRRQGPLRARGLQRPGLPLHGRCPERARAPRHRMLRPRVSPGRGPHGRGLPLSPRLYRRPAIARRSAACPGLQIPAIRQATRRPTGTIRLRRPRRPHPPKRCSRQIRRPACLRWTHAGARARMPPKPGMPPPAPPTVPAASITGRFRWVKTAKTTRLGVMPAVVMLPRWQPVSGQPTSWRPNPRCRPASSSRCTKRRPRWPAPPLRRRLVWSMPGHVPVPSRPARPRPEPRRVFP